jgi:two-component system CheB/CheR fusion protein
MAFVLVQHLDPKHPSDLREILARTTKIPVQEVADGIRVEPDRIYVIPPNTSMAMKAGILRLAARVLTRGQHMPIDHLLRSLAEDRGSQAISVILSGTASEPKAPAPSKRPAESPSRRMKNRQSTAACRTA